ncbi:MAG: GyrI-like domain-containing protein [Flavobacterium sp.]|jgi:AraC family transcriptional regulator|uniref:AraC family transcriptional regulator n=1 Tax=Flavobacterium sp. TaxID=239 RepID=UPI0022C7CF35|nr:GyrI-like domain-containing protein [Flavobacterium sp.]MCZ8298420.1 GyrI-like domain-containing protein [Flavobacterium sp.]
MRTDTKNSYLESINKAIAFIESNSTTDIQLKDIAIQANLSQYHFHRVFKSLTGDTTKDFLTRLRLEKAALKLKHSQNDIGQIAFDCGYQNHETFTRAFKEYFGLTPLEYRNSIAELTTNKQNEYGKANIDLNALNVQGPVIKTIPDLHLAYIRHTGSYDKVGSSFQKLMFWAATHLVLKLKPVTIGIVHDNPDLTAEQHIRFDACVLLSKEIKPNGEIGYKRIEGGKFAVFTYKGAYEGFYPVYDYIYNVCLFDNKFDLADKPALEWYIKSPPFNKPENFVTDFYVPIK